MDKSLIMSLRYPYRKAKGAKDKVRGQVGIQGREAYQYVRRTLPEVRWPIKGRRSIHSYHLASSTPLT